MSLRDHFVTLARYHQWATRRLLDDHLARLPDADYRRDCGLFFRSIHGTLNHLLVAELSLWLRRFVDGFSPEIRLDGEVEADRARLHASLLDGAAQWLQFVEAQPASRFAQPLRYQTTSNRMVELPFAAALAHVFNHGTHHRGQISAALTAMGQPIPLIDLVFMLQQDASSR
jgi:uncharacterized damage-inducible protein DinB